MMKTFAWPFLAASLVAILTVFFDRSRIAFGPFALYGNGALIVPMVGAALVLFVAWTTLLRRGVHLPSLIVAALGVYLGIGVLGPAEALTQSSPGFDANVVMSFLFQGLFFVVPTALLAALAAWAFLSGGLPLHPIALAIVAIAGLPLAGNLAPLAVGLGTGVAIAIAVRSTSRQSVILSGLGLLAFLLFVGFGVPALYVSTSQRG